jgi:8-oxo-dGTP diphosphatase
MFNVALMKNEILPAVAAIIFNDKQEILLQKRTTSRKWCIISGHVEFGESVAEAMLREITEETGTTGEIIRLIGVYSSPASQTYHHIHGSKQYVTTYFEVKLHGVIEDNYSNEETLSLQFFKPEELPGDLDMMHPEWLRDGLNTKGVAVVR